MQAHALDNSTESQANVSSCQDSPPALVNNSLPFLPARHLHALCTPYVRSHTGPTETFMLELPTPVLVWEPQSTPSTDRSKGIRPRPCLSVLHPVLTAHVASRGVPCTSPRTISPACCCTGSPASTCHPLDKCLFNKVKT